MGSDIRASSFVHHHSQSPYRDQKLAAASAAITSIAARLGLSPTRVEEVLCMANSATGGNLASPGTAFLPALAAACAFLVARSHRIPLSLAEAAEATFCSTASLADLASRIASHLSLPPLPSFDYAAALDRAVRFRYGVPCGGWREGWRVRGDLQGGGGVLPRAGKGGTGRRRRAVDAACGGGEG